MRINWMYALVVVLLLNGGTAIAQNLVINELMARNANGQKDEFGDDDDWIEIYNPGASAVNLAGYYISDVNVVASYYRIPNTNAAKTTVPAGGYLLLWADGEPAEGANHLPFKLSNGGEEVFLGTLNGGNINIISQVAYPKLERDVSYGRYPNATGAYKLLSDPTPGAKNKPVRVISGNVINEIVAVNNGSDTDEDNEAEDWFEFYNTTNQPVDIGGLYLTDSIGELTMHRIPIYRPDSTTIPAKGFLRFWVDAEPTTSVWHVDFKLGRGGEKITLTQPDGQTIIQEISYPAAQPDASFGQYPDGSGNWIYLNRLTPNAANTHVYQAKQGILINEFLADNESGYPDNLGEFEDWIEFYNPGSTPVDVGGLIISDDLSQPFTYRIPETSPDSTTIQPGGYLVFWADNQPEQGILHLDLKLTGLGEAIGLYQYRTSLVTLDSYQFGPQTTGVSTGRSPDGSSNWVTFSSPSPGKANSGGTNPIISGLYVNEFMARNTNGYQDEFGNIDDWIELYNSTNSPIDIGGLYFSDDRNDPQKTMIPTGQANKTTVPAKGYLIVWPDAKPNLGPLHVNFQLAGAGEDIGVYQYYNGAKYVVQELSYPAQNANVSYGRAPDASSNWHFFGTPTPNGPNAATGLDVWDLPNETSLFPNPANLEESLQVNTMKEGIHYLEIRDISGKLIHQNNFMVGAANSTHQTASVSALGIRNPGVYFVTIRSEEEQRIHRLIVY